MTATRQEVYAAIDGEREYQAKLERNAIKEQRPMEQVALIRHLLRQFDAEWYSQPGQPSMDTIRKIGAMCVRMMEEHGAPARAASGMSASGQDPQGLEAKPASPTAESGDAHNPSPKDCTGGGHD